MKYKDKYLWWGLTACGVVAFGILFFFFIFQIDRVLEGINTLFGILRPIIYGIVMAYLLNPIYNWFHRYALGWVCACDKKHRLHRPTTFAKFLAILLTMLLALLIIGGLLAMVIPQTVISVMGIVESLPRNLDNLADWIEQLLVANPQWEQAALGLYDRVITLVSSWVESDLMPNLEQLAGHVSLGIIGTVSFVVDVVIGVIVTIYALAGKETFAAQGKKLIYAALGRTKGNLAVENFRFVHKVFGGFINGKLLDSLIIGLICFGGMTLLRMPYAVLISVIVGATNVIPFFGPFIGAIPSAIILLLADPVKCFWFIIFILVLQQFDGNILGPKILGDSTGLTSFWVLFAILLFGGIFGFVGMVVGVPAFAVLYTIISSITGRALRKKGLEEETWKYRDLQQIDEVTGEYICRGESTK